MKPVYLAVFLLTACKTQGVPPSIAVASDITPRLFTDSAIYRAQCKEADSLKSLNPIPRKCTPRDQRVKIY